MCAKGRAYLVRHEDEKSIYIRIFGNLSYLDKVTSDGTMCPGVGSASENEYQGFLLG